MNWIRIQSGQWIRIRISASEGKLNPDPYHYQHESQKQDPGLYKSQNPEEAVEAQNSFYCSMDHRYQYRMHQNRAIRTIKLKE
jgi:hypothetical protein